MKSKVLKIFGKFFFFLLTLILAGVIALQTSAVQSWIVGRIAESLNDRFAGKIYFKSIAFQPFNHILLKDVVLIDSDPLCIDGTVPADTVLAAESIHASFSLWGLIAEDGIHISQLQVNEADARIVQEPDGRLNLQRMFETSEGGSSSLFLRRILVKESRLQFIPRSGDDSISIDSRFNLQASGLEFVSSDNTTSLKVAVNSFSARDRSGATIRDMSGNVSYSDGRVNIRNLKIDDGFSVLHAPSIKAVIPTTKDGQPGIDRINVSLTVTDSRLAAASATLLEASFANDPTVLEITRLEASGKIDDIKVSVLEVREASTGIEARLKGNLKGLGREDDPQASLQLDRLSFTTDRLEQLYSRYTGQHDGTIGSIAPGQWITVSGQLHGPLSHLEADAALSTAADGSMTLHADMRNLFKDSGNILAHLDISTHELDLGSILGNDLLKPTTLDARLDARLSDLSNSLFARISSHEPELDFDVEIGALTRQRGRDTIKVKGEVRHADLTPFMPSSMPLSGVAMRIDAGAHTLNEAYEGVLNMSDIVLKSADGSIKAGSADFRILNDTKGCRASLRSDIINADFAGSSDPFEMIEDVLCHTLKREAPILFQDDKDHSSCSANSYSISAITGDMSEIMPYFIPGLYLSHGTSVELRADGTGLVEGEVSTIGIAYEGYYARDINARIDNRESRLSLYTSVSEIGVNDVFLQNDILTLNLDDNMVSLAALYDNNSSPQSEAEFFADAVLYRNDADKLCCRVDLSESELIASGLKWAFAPSSLTFEPDFAEARGFRAECEDQLISVNGLISNKFDGQMEILVQNFKLNTFNPLLHPDYRMDGLADGKVLVISPVEDSFNLMANMHSVDTHIGGRNFGNFNVATVLDPEENRLALSFNNIFNEKVTLTAKGSLDIAANELDIDVHADSLSLGCAEPLLVGIISDAEGFISGDIHVGGNFDMLDLSSEDVQIEDGWFVVDYTHVPYFIEGDIEIDNSGLHFMDNPITDRYGHKGKVSGKIGWDHYNDWNLEILTEFTGAEVIDIAEGADQMINGNVFASGTANFLGPTNNVLCDINLKSVGQGTFVLPLVSYEEDSVIDLLSFRQADEEDTDNFLFMARKTKKVHEVADNLRFRIKLEITPDLLTNIEMDKSTGSAIVSRGNGSIDITASTSPELFDINGDYTLESGDFHFVVLGVANRTFDIKTGSAVHFNGDLDDTDLDIKASYMTKASISNLIADTTAVATRRNVECGINIGNTLANPSLSFAITVPDLDPTMKARVDGALNTDDKIQKQFIALLVTGGFIPDEESGIVLNSSNILYSNVAGIMAGQLNNILQKFNIPLDLGLSYQANEGGTDIFDVAVSTELFNNRVIVNGSVGNRDNTKRVGATSSTTSSDVVGDVDIEIKLDREGQVRMNMFSHSADEYTNFLDNSQRNGVGITYQKEFNTVKEFFRDIFRKKKDKEQQPASEIEQITVTMD